MHQGLIRRRDRADPSLPFSCRQVGGFRRKSPFRSGRPMLGSGKGKSLRIARLEARPAGWLLRLSLTSDRIADIFKLQPKRSSEG